LKIDIATEPICISVLAGKSRMELKKKSIIALFSVLILSRIL